MLSSSAFAGWQVHYVPEVKESHYQRPERVTLTYNRGSSDLETLADALKAIKMQGKIEKLDFIRPHPFTESDDFQDELIGAFKELAPEEWTRAEKSAGNMHNPKMTPLRKHLTEAFLRTSLAKRISRDLEPYGLVIAEFGQEKLSYQEKNGKRRIRGIFHISIALKKKAEQDGAGQPPTAPESK